MDTQQSILVLGAGVAGLTAAEELARAGWRVILLEARRRLGGRIFTEESGGIPLELGAEFIHGGNEPLWQRIQLAGLQTNPVADDSRLFSEGALHPVDLWSEVLRVIQRIDPKAPDQSFADFLAAQDVSEQVKKLALAFVSGFEAADPAKISARALWSSETGQGEDPGAQQFRLAQGYGALVDFMARQLPPIVEVKTGAIVRSLRWRQGHVEALAEIDGRETAFTTNAAIVTLPLGVLKAGTVVFHPPLSGKARAVADLQFGNVVKLVLRFRRPWWPEPKLGFIHALDEALPTWWSDDRGPVLTGWAGGPQADALWPWTCDGLVDQGLTILGRIFHTSTDSLRRELVDARAHDWRSDPFTGGAYSYTPINGMDLVKTLAAPVADTLFFAGEATVSDAEPGTVHGALASGLRAAQEVEHGFRRTA